MLVLATFFPTSETTADSLDVTAVSFIQTLLCITIKKYLQNWGENLNDDECNYSTMIKNHVLYSKYSRTPRTRLTRTPR